MIVPPSVQEICDLYHFFRNLRQVIPEENWVLKR